MLKDKIKYAVVGVGNMGKNHARICSEISGADLAAVSDLDETIGREIASKFKCKYYKDYNEMIASEKLDAVSICVPTALHYKISKIFIENGICVLLEKPIALNIEDANDLVELASEKKIKFLTGHIERFNPVVKKVKEMIDGGELGKVIAVMARRVGGFPPQIKDSNIAVDLAIHDIDIVNYLLGKLPKEICANKQRNHIEQREDSVEFFIKYDGCSAYIQANWVTPVKIRKLNITGTKGYLEMDYITQTIQFYKSNYDKYKEVIGDFSDYILRFSEPDIINISVNKKEPLKEEILYFLDCVANGKEVDSKFAADALMVALKD